LVNPEKTPKSPDAALPAEGQKAIETTPAKQPSAGQPLVEQSPTDSATEVVLGTANVGPLKTRNIVLDTQTIYGENFKYDSSRLRDLKTRVAAGQLRVLMTDINEREVRAGIRKRVKEAVEAFGSKVRNGARILSNLTGEYGLLFDPKKEADVVSRLTKQFDQFLVDAKVEIIPSGHLPIGPLFDRYFDIRPPFEDSTAKKSEFPDAAIVMAIIDWADKNGEETYIVSGDAGVREAAGESSRLHPVESLGEVLARATVTYEPSRVHLTARTIFGRLRDDVVRRIEEVFTELEFSWNDYDYGDPEVVGITVRRIAASPALLVDIDRSLAHFELEAAVEYKVDVRYDDPDAIHYDREDGRTYVFNRIHAEARARLILPVSVTVAFDPVTDSGEIEDVTVNDGREVIVVPDELTEVSSDRDEEWPEAWGDEGDGIDETAGSGG
jgi:hypothetical protein